ncbi:MAG: hypothetical protein ACR2HD_04135 [Solirubrobacteraceae bacterium]|nr:MAG: hypothetical protein DLM63_01600 [Solirubrobacterales bacterium]
MPVHRITCSVLPARRPIVALLAVAFAASPTAALSNATSPATLALDHACYDQTTSAQRTPVVITGSGFASGESVGVRAGGIALGTANADQNGSFMVTATVPTLSTASSPIPLVRHFTLQALDETTGTTIPIAPARLTVATLALSVLPPRASPSQLVTFRATGLISATGTVGTLFAHYLFHGHLIRTVSLGTLGRCGNITVDRPLLPTRARRGAWRIQFDQSHAYSPHTTPRISDTLTIS